MKRALILLVALAAPADAKGDPTCSCERPRVLPAPSAVDVPTNTRFWRLPSRRPGVRIKPYDLTAHTGYVLQDVSFTTGAGPDQEPPIPPSVTDASVTLVVATPRAPVSLLHVTAATSADTAVVHLRFTDARGLRDDYYTTPDQLTIREPDIAISPGHVRLDVTALDLAGNESPADTVELDTTTDPFPSPRCTATAVAVDNQRAALGGVFLFALAGMGMFLARANLRRRDRERTTAAPFALPAVEELARGVRVRSLCTIALAGIATSYALHAPAIAGDALALSPLAALLVIDAVVRYIAAGRVRALLRYDGATADVQHDTVSVSVGKHRASMRAAPGLVDRARHHALPRASL